MRNSSVHIQSNHLIEEVLVFLLIGQILEAFRDLRSAPEEERMLIQIFGAETYMSSFYTASKITNFSFA